MSARSEVNFVAKAPPPPLSGQVRDLSAIIGPLMWQGLLPA